MKTNSGLIKPLPFDLNKLMGIFTPSWSGNFHLPDKLIRALHIAQSNHIKVRLAQFSSPSYEKKGYRVGDGSSRAQELNSLIADDDVGCIMASIGGLNSSSLIPHIDFPLLKKKRKCFVGCSDITALHLAINKYSQLSTFYGPSFLPYFGEYAGIPRFSLNSLLNALSNRSNAKREILPPEHTSSTFIDATKKNWKTEKREWIANPGWIALVSGYCRGSSIVAETQTLCMSLGTDFCPDFRGKILFLEEVDCLFSQTEARLMQLRLAGVFDKISGLVFSKQTALDPQGAEFTFRDLVLEIVPQNRFPIITNFDCGHCFPMLTIAQGILVEIDSRKSDRVEFNILESSVSS